MNEFWERIIYFPESGYDSNQNHEKNRIICPRINETYTSNDEVATKKENSTEGI